MQKGCTDVVLCRHRKLDSSPDIKIFSSPVRRRKIFKFSVRIMTVIVCLFIRLLWLVCGVQRAHGCYIVWCLHLGPYPVLQRSTETTGCSVFKSLVCHLNEAFGAKNRRKKFQHENTTVCWTLARTRLGCFGNMLVLLFGLLFFPVYSLTTIYPQGTRASRWGKKGMKLTLYP